MTNDDLFFPKPKKARRVLALIFPQLSADLYRRRMKQDASSPLALHEKVDSALRIAALDQQAKALGLYESQPLAEARALVPALRSAALDRTADAADFEKLLGALLRYSPLVGSPGFGAAFIDITGCAGLFGGEEALARDALIRLRSIKIAARGAIASTVGCAWAMARCDPPRKFAARISVPPFQGGEKRAEKAPRRPRGFPPLEKGESRGEAATGGIPAAIVPPGGEKAALAPLPVAALRLDPEIADVLKSLGLKTIGALMARSRKELARRFGETPLARLDAATGAGFEPISPIAPTAEYSAGAVLAEPVMSLEAGLLVAERLASALSDKLEGAGLGARRFQFSLFRLDMSVERADIVLGAPSRSAKTILRLLRLKLEKGEREIDPGFGFEAFRLSAFETAPIPAAQRSSLSEGAGDEFAALRDRLVNHLGAAVFRLRPVASHVPERAEAKESALEEAVPWADEAPERPLLLLDPPEPILATAPLPDGPPASFRWRRISYRVARAAGPERILGEWRRREDFLRDYYRIEDERGRRYWVFREGVYEAGAKWFLHGFFA